MPRRHTTAEAIPGDQGLGRHAEHRCVHSTLQVLRPFLLELMRVVGLTVQGTQRRGARFLDIRVCWSQDTAMYHTLHFILGSPTEGKPFTSSGNHQPSGWYSRALARTEMLGNITQFLTDFPEEIVILQWGSFAGYRPCSWLHLHSRIGPHPCSRQVQ